MPFVGDLASSTSGFFLCFFLGIFEQPYRDMANLIWKQTLAKGQARGLHETGNIRHMERLIMHADTLMFGWKRTCT